MNKDKLTRRINVLIIDEDETYRKDLENYLREEGFHIAGSLYNESGRDFLLVKPDIAIVAFKETAPLFYRSLKLLRKLYSSIKIVVCIKPNSRVLEDSIQEEGIEGLVTKSQSGFEEVLVAITEVINDKVYYSPKRKRKRKRIPINKTKYL
jgi:DNA-binding NarL/FixJ family response regulator